MDQRATPFRFGIFEVDVASGELRRDGVRIKLQEQPFQVLAALIERPGEVVAREDLQKRLWPGDVNIDFDRGLNKAINRLREALGDDADHPTFIETLPHRGYRFLASLDAPPAAAVATPAKLRRNLLISAAGVAAVTAGYRWLPVTTRKIESIAVLPLENLSGNPAQEYFSDSLTDELIGEIARIGSLRVISRTSVMQYKRGVRKSLPAIARELNVDAILEGTVTQVGQRVRITAQLIRAADDRHLWSEHFERDLTDILAVQSEVARAVADQIQIKLTPEERTHLTRTRRVNPAAYDAFLQGNFYLHRGIRGTQQSIDFFKQAIALDPLQAEAYAGLAQALCYGGIFGIRPSRETHPEARVAALKALEIDESNASAHNALADVKKGYDWNLAAALVEYRRALHLNASHVLARLWYAECLSRLERHEEAVNESGRAIALDPVAPIGYSNRGMLLWRARRYDDAIRDTRHALDLDPNFVNAYWWQGLAYAGKQDFPKSIAALTKAIGLNGLPLFRAALGYVSALAGDRAKALGILEGLRLMSQKKRYISPVDVAIVHAGLGDAEATFRWMEKACLSRAARAWEVVTPCFDRFRADPRYADLKRRVGL